jgi:hypothetical protein
MSGSAAQRWSVAVRQRRMLRTRSSRAQRSKLVAGCSSGGGGGARAHRWSAAAAGAAKVSW